MQTQTSISKLKLGFTTRFAEVWNNSLAIIVLAAVLVEMKTSQNSQNILRQLSST